MLTGTIGGSNAGGPADDEPACYGRRIAINFGFARLLLLLDQPFRFLANLTSLGLVSVLVASLIQYSSWRDDKALSRHKEELSNAISSFSEISGFLSATMNLQQIMYYTQKNAAGTFGTLDEQQLNYLLANTKSILAEYTTSRIALRKNVDVLIGKSDLFIDRPTRSQAQRIVTDVAKTNELLVFSNRDVLRNHGFSCSKHLSQPEPIQLGDISIDWTQTRNHVATFYYCLEELHYELFPVRVWAQAAAVGEQGGPSREKSSDEKTRAQPSAQLSKERMKQIEDDFELQTKRLNDFIAVGTAKIEQMRLRTSDDGFFRHQFCFFCSD
jgi:hypothetical protein